MVPTKNDQYGNKFIYQGIYIVNQGQLQGTI
jgi:hypothetical protein